MKSIKSVSERKITAGREIIDNELSKKVDAQHKAGMDSYVRLRILEIILDGNSTTKSFTRSLDIDPETHRATGGINSALDKAAKELGFEDEFEEAKIITEYKDDIEPTKGESATAKRWKEVYKENNSLINKLYRVFGKEPKNSNNNELLKYIDRAGEKMQYLDGEYIRNLSDLEARITDHFSSLGVKDEDMRRLASLDDDDDDDDDDIAEIYSDEDEEVSLDADLDDQEPEPEEHPAGVDSTLYIGDVKIYDADGNEITVKEILNSVNYSNSVRDTDRYNVVYIGTDDDDEKTEYKLKWAYEEFFKIIKPIVSFLKESSESNNLIMGLQEPFGEDFSYLKSAREFYKRLCELSTKYLGKPRKYSKSKTEIIREIDLKRYIDKSQDRNDKIFGIGGWLSSRSSTIINFMTRAAEGIVKSVSYIDASDIVQHAITGVNLSLERVVKMEEGIKTYGDLIDSIKETNDEEQKKERVKKALEYFNKLMDDSQNKVIKEYLTRSKSEETAIEYIGRMLREKYFNGPDVKEKLKSAMMGSDFRDGDDKVRTLTVYNVAKIASKLTRRDALNEKNKVLNRMTKWNKEDEEADLGLSKELDAFQANIIDMFDHAVDMSKSDPLSIEKLLSDPHFKDKKFGKIFDGARAAVKRFIATHVNALDKTVDDNRFSKIVKVLLEDSEDDVEYEHGTKRKMVLKELDGSSRTKGTVSYLVDKIKEIYGEEGGLSEDVVEDALSKLGHLRYFGNITKKMSDSDSGRSNAETEFRRILKDIALSNYDAAENEVFKSLNKENKIQTDAVLNKLKRSAASLVKSLKRMMDTHMLHHLVLMLQSHFGEHESKSYKFLLNHLSSYDPYITDYREFNKNKESISGDFRNFLGEGDSKSVDQDVEEFMRQLSIILNKRKSEMVKYAIDKIVDMYKMVNDSISKISDMVTIHRTTSYMEPTVARFDLSDHRKQVVDVLKARFLSGEMNAFEINEHRDNFKKDGWIVVDEDGDWVPGVDNKTGGYYPDVTWIMGNPPVRSLVIDKDTSKEENEKKKTRKNELAGAARALSKKLLKEQEMDGRMFDVYTRSDIDLNKEEVKDANIEISKHVLLHLFELSHKEITNDNKDSNVDGVKVPSRYESMYRTLFKEQSDRNKSIEFLRYALSYFQLSKDIPNVMTGVKDEKYITILLCWVKALAVFLNKDSSGILSYGGAHKSGLTPEECIIKTKILVEAELKHKDMYRILTSKMDHQLPKSHGVVTDVYDFGPLSDNRKMIKSLYDTYLSLFKKFKSEFGEKDVIDNHIEKEKSALEELLSFDLDSGDPSILKDYSDNVLDLLEERSLTIRDLSKAGLHISTDSLNWGMPKSGFERDIDADVIKREIPRLRQMNEELIKEVRNKIRSERFDTLVKTIYSDENFIRFKREMNVIINLQREVMMSVSPPDDDEIRSVETKSLIYAIKSKLGMDPKSNTVMVNTGVTPVDPDNVDRKEDVLFIDVDPSSSGKTASTKYQRRVLLSSSMDVLCNDVIKRYIGLR